MLDLQYPRELVMIGAVFGVAAFAWAGWGQENPPGHVAWRVVLGGLSVAGLVLAALSVPIAIRHWRTPTAIDPGGTAFRVYLIVFWLEVIIGAVLAFLAARAGRPDLVAPLILAVVGVHFFALAIVFHQPVLHVAAAVLTMIAILAALLRVEAFSPSFWCAILGAPVFLAIGGWCLAAGKAVLGAA